MTIQRAEVNWAVVGTGFVSQCIAEDLRLTPGARRYAVCSRSAERAQLFAAERGFTRAYASFRTMLSDPSVEAVYIATPHATHTTLAIAALEAGKHILIEKPMALDAAEARRIRDVARARRRFAMEAMWMRFNPAYRELVGSARAGTIGEIRSVRASFGLPFGSARSGQWTAQRGSSTLLDQGVYPVTFALDLLGRPTRIRAGGRVREDGVDLTEHITFEYDGGRFAQLSASMIEYIEPTASVSGTDGWMTIPAPFWAATEFEIHAGGIARALGESNRVRFERQGNGYVPMLEAATHAIVNGQTEHALHSLSDTITTLSLIDAIRGAVNTPAIDEETR